MGITLWAGLAPCRAEVVRRREREARIVIRFRKAVQKTRLLDPRCGYVPVEVTSEVRFDPLTQETGRVAHFLPTWPPPAGGKPGPREVQGGFCPFCPENVERVTPKFPQDVVPEGRMRRGEAVLFPNLSPYAEFSAVTVVCADHSPTLGELTPEKVADAVRLSLDFLATVCRGRPDLHPFVCWNYLPPAGASQPHPHLQPFASTVPGNALGAELRAERAYREEEGRSFWADLLKEEKVCGERYLGRIGGTEWVVAFRPRGALGEVIGLFPEGQSLVYLGEELVRDVAVGLTRLFAFMQASNLFSFNLVLYQGGEGARLRFIPRFYIQPALHASDVNFLLMGCGEPLAVITPEDVAARIRPFFNS